MADRSALSRLFLVRAGERALVAYLFTYFLLVGAGLAIGRASADALFFKRYGIEYLPVLFMVLAGLLALTSTLYAAVVDRLPAERGYTAIAVPLVLLLLAGWWAIRSGAGGWLYPAYYLLYELASELLLVHGALFLGQNLDTLAAKRLAALVLAGGQIGSMAGGVALAATAPAIGVENLPLLWCALLAGAIALVGGWQRRHASPPFFRAPRRGRQALPEAVRRVREALRATRDHALLRAGALSMFFMVVSFYILWYAANRVYVSTFQSEEALAAFFGLLGAATSSLSLLLQLFVTGRLIEWAGVRRVHLLYPATTLASFVALIAHFGLPSALLTSLGKDVLLPAFRNPARAVIFSVLPPRLQGGARAVWVAVVMPAGLLACGAALWALQHLDDPLPYLLPGALLAGLYLHYARRVNRAYVQTLVADLKRRLVLPPAREYQALRGAGEDLLGTLAAGLHGPDDAIALGCARALAAAFPERAAGLLSARLVRMGAANADRMVRLLPTLPPALQGALLEHAAAHGDPHLQATVLDALIAARPEAARPQVARALHSSHPRLAAVGIRGVLRGGPRTLRGEALAVWGRLLTGAPPEALAALELLPELALLSAEEVDGLRPRVRAALRRLLDQPDEAVVGRALAAVATWDAGVLPEVEAPVGRLASAAEPGLRAAAMRCIPLLPSAAERERLILAGLADGHRAVRAAAVAVLAREPPGALGLLERWLIVGNRGSPRAQATLLESVLETGAPGALLAEVARVKVADARRLRQALAVIERAPSAGAATALLGHVLAERVAQTADLALLALQPLEDPQTIAAVRAGLRSVDPRDRANACETLANLDGQGLGKVLSGLLGGATERAGPPLGTVREVLAWCAGREDEWLRCCALGALDEAGAEAARG